MEFEHLHDITAETEDDETLLVSDIVFSDGAQSAMNTTRKKPRRERSIALLALIVVSGLIFIGSVTVVGVFAAKQREQNQLRQANEQEQEQQQIQDEEDIYPILLTRSPTPGPTRYPSSRPSDYPSLVPTQKLEPTTLPTGLPSSTPSAAPTTAATQNTTIFYAVGDAPYTNDQAIGLLKDVTGLPGDADFFVHVGDLRKAGEDCVRSDYRRVAAILQESAVPVFVILGDNDWNDCPNMKNGMKMWKLEFVHFDQRHWDVPWTVRRQEGREENFSFELKGTLFIGLNLVGGQVHSVKEWKDRLGDQVEWTIDLIREYNKELGSKTGRIVIFGHADPSNKHNAFFNPLGKFIEKELDNRVPLLYVNGDSHHWSYDKSFLGQSSWLRMMVTGRSVDPPLKVVVNADGEYEEAVDAFVYDRRLR